MLGLYTALTGQVLPGCVKAIAEGNALGKGPVVFELFQSGINLIRTQAAGIAAYPSDSSVWLHRFTSCLNV